MREIGLVADDLDVGGILEGVFIHIAPLRDAHFGEAGATIESPVPNLRHRWRDGDAHEAGATLKSTYKYFIWIMIRIILIILIILCVPFTLNLRFPFRYYKRSQLFLGKFLNIFPAKIT